MMRFARVGSAIAGILRLFSWMLLVPIPIALLYEEWDFAVGPMDLPRNALVFLASFAIAIVAWLPMHLLSRRAVDDDLLDREAYLSVGIGWLVITIAGMVPFLLSGVLTSPIDAWFETMSGLTTTGLSAISNVDGVAASVLFWRAFLQWLGGLGIIVLMVALLSQLTHGGLQLFQAEAAGHSARIKPKLAETARTLWLMYAGITAIFITILFAIFYLRLGLDPKMAIFESVTHVFTGYATGGFSTHTASIAFFDDWVVELALVIVMLIGATSFGLAFGLIRRGLWRPLFRSSEWRFYIFSALLGIGLGFGILIYAGRAVTASLRDSLFNVVSLYTGTGFASADYAGWPEATIVLLLVLMLMGGMAGSTTGAVKSIRWLILFKAVARQLRKLLHPRAVIALRTGNRVITEDVLATVIAFFFSYLLVWTAGTVLIVATDPLLGVVDGAAVAASSIGNVGGGLGTMGPFASPGVPGLLPSTKIILSALMWIGRLEIFTALLLFYPSSWRS